MPGLALVTSARWPLRRPETMTWLPRLWKASAYARPMPEVPPVMKMVLPVRFMLAPSNVFLGLDAAAGEIGYIGNSAGFAGGRIGGEGFGEIFGAGGIGVELEDAGNVGTGFVELAGVAGDMGEVHADGAAAGSTIEGVLPERDGAVEMAGAGFDDAEIRSGVDQFGVGLESVLVECAGFCGVAAALCDEGEAV